MSCGVGRRHSSDLLLLRLWLWLVATAPIRPLAWDTPCATSAALKRDKKTHTHTHTHVQTKNDAMLTYQEFFLIVTLKELIMNIFKICQLMFLLEIQCQ